MASSDWVTLDDLKTDQTIGACNATTKDDASLQLALDAAMDWVEAHRTDLDYHGSWTVPADVRLGTIRLAGRWFVRRISPNGIVQLGDLSSGMVLKVDPDIYMQLGIIGGLA